MSEIFQRVQPKQTYYHHSMTYPDGTFIQGKLDHGQDLSLYGNMASLIEGSEVLDIATNDGYWAFWAEQQGGNVFAMDVGGYDGYDWGANGMPASAKHLGQQDKWETFWIHHEAMKSKVHALTGSVYDLRHMYQFKAQKFNLIMNYGLLYHLRDPRGALDECRRVCDGAMILETQVLPFAHTVPMALDCGNDIGLLTDTDNNWPTESCVAHWLKEAGFPRIFIQYRNTKRSQTRQRFIACVDDKWAEHFEHQNAFFEVNDMYWAKCKQATSEFADKNSRD